MTIAELTETIPALRAEIARLQAENKRLKNYVQCAYCGQVFKIADVTNQESHWRNCPDHPARLELKRLEAEIEQLRAAR